MQGHTVHFVGADDAHGAPIMLAAEKAGKSPEAFVADIARGRYQTTSVRTANRLAIALDCSIEDLFPLVDDAPKVGAR
jgi:methionyl-tRNA synthetase